MTKFSLPLFLIAAFPLFLSAQNLLSGEPFVRYIPPSEYKGGPQIFSIAQDRQGVIYFGNNNGMLEYDGTNWQTHTLSNNTIVRSLAMDETGRKYFAGGQFELGFFEPQPQNGKLVFHSLKSHINEKEENFEDVWRIFPFPNDEVYFNTSRKFFRIDAAGKVMFIPPSIPGNLFEFAFFCRDTLFAFEWHTGLTKLQGDKMVIADTFFYNKPIANILPLEDNGILVATQKHGIFYYNENEKIEAWCKKDLQDYFISNQIYCAIKIKDGYAFGTKQDGLLILDKRGKPLMHVNRKKGLRNDNVRCLFEDRDGNIWMGLDNGIAFVSMQSPWKRLNLEPWLHTLAYSAAVYEKKLYLGTGKGVYCNSMDALSQPFGSKTFSLVKGSKGEAWSLTRLGADLLLGHHSGTFSIQNDRALLLDTVPGGWTYLEVPGRRDLVIGGFYNGLVLFQRQGDQGAAAGHWKFVSKIKGFDESCRVMEFDEKSRKLIVSHVYKGLFFLQLSEDFSRVISVTWFSVEKYPGRLLATDTEVQVVSAKEKGLPSLNQINVFKTNATGVVFATEKGLYVFKNSVFVYDMALNKAIGDSSHVTRLLQQENQLWYVANARMGLLNISPAGDYVSEKDDFLHRMDNNWIQNFEYILPVGRRELLVGTPEGFLVYDKKWGKNPVKPSVLIRKIEASDRKWVLFSGAFNSKAAPISIPGNDIWFTVACPSFENPSGNKFRYFLEGYKQDTSEWTTTPVMAYTNLSNGESYTFHVWAKNDLNQISEVATVVIHIGGVPMKVWIWILGIALVFAGAFIWFLGRRKPLRLVQVMQEDNEEKDEIIEDLTKDQLLYGKKLEEGKDLLKEVVMFLSAGEKTGKVDPVKTSGLGRRISDLVKEMEELKGPILLPYEQAIIRKLEAKLGSKNTKQIYHCYWLLRSLDKEEIMKRLKIDSSNAYDVALHRLRKKLGLTPKDDLINYLRNL